MSEKNHGHNPDSPEGLRCRIAAFRAMARAALRMNSSESVRLKRYQQKMDRANELQKRLDEATQQKRTEMPGFVVGGVIGAVSGPIERVWIGGFLDPAPGDQP